MNEAMMPRKKPHDSQMHQYYHTLPIDGVSKDCASGVHLASMDVSSPSKESASFAAAPRWPRRPSLSASGLYTVESVARSSDSLTVRAGRGRLVLSVDSDVVPPELLGAPSRGPEQNPGWPAGLVQPVLRVQVPTGPPITNGMHLLESCKKESCTSGGLRDVAPLRRVAPTTAGVLCSTRTRPEGCRHRPMQSLTANLWLRRYPLACVVGWGRVTVCQRCCSLAVPAPVHTRVAFRFRWPSS